MAETLTSPSARRRRAILHPGQIWRRQRVHWRRRVVGSVAHDEALRRIDDRAAGTGQRLLMLGLAAGLTAAGLLLSSPVVVVAALLIAPLGAPLTALGFALARFDFPRTRRGLLDLLAGLLLALAVTAAIVGVSPLQTVTPAIQALTRPNLLLLLVAAIAGVASASAGTRGRGEAMAGVVVAAALLPPLAVVGFGLATLNATVALGAGALLLASLVAILLGTAFVAKLYGFAARGEPASPGQTAFILGVLLLLSLPLAASLHQIGEEAAGARTARDAIVRYFGSDARLSRLEMDYTADPVVARATVQADRRRLDADRQIGERLTAALGQPVSAQITQLLVGSAASRRERERQELEAARKLEGESLKRANEAEARAIAGELGILGGGSDRAVLVDRIGRRASLYGDAVPGVLLPAWRALETRVASRHPGWMVTVVPPLTSLPLIPFEAGMDSLSPASMRAVADTAWALHRWGVASAVVNGRVASGEADGEAARIGLAEARAAAVGRALRARGIAIASRTSTTGTIQAEAEARDGRAALQSAQILPDLERRTLRAAGR